MGPVWECVVPMHTHMMCNIVLHMGVGEVCPTLPDIEDILHLSM